MTSQHYRRSQIPTQSTGDSNPVRSDHHLPMRLSHSRRLLITVGVLLALLGICYPSRAQDSFTYNPNHLDTAKIIQAMKTPHSDLRILSAHRGLHAKFGDDPNIAGIPENSLSSVEAAAQAGLELLEVDVKLTFDGKPICSHDLTWGRETNPVQAGGHVFDPFSSPFTDAQKQANPRVNSLTLADTQAQFNLRDSVSFLPNYGSHYEIPATLQNVIDRVNRDQIAAVIAIDVKDVDTFKAAWNVVNAATDWKGKPFAGHVAWKVSGFSYTTPAAFKADFPDYGLINFWPNYNTSQVAANLFGSEQAMIDSLNLFWADPTISLIAPEITQKQAGGIFDRMRRTGINMGHTVAEFAAYKDYVYPNDPNKIAQFFWTGTAKDDVPQPGGSCCVDLKHYFFNPVTNEDGTPNSVYDSNRPTDTADNRGDFDFVVNQMGFNVITTDDVIHWDTLLSGNGLRNLSYMQLDGYQGDPHCKVLNDRYPGCDADNTTVYTYCAAAEGGTCSFIGYRNVAYGANGHCNYFAVQNSTACNVATLGPDPIVGVHKACYYSAAIQPPYDTGVYCADENGTCSFQGGSNGWATVFFGTGSSFGTYAGATNSFTCNIAPFGANYPDPAPGLVKTCFYKLYSSNLYSGPSGYILCATGDVGQTCRFSGAARIAYGANGSFVYRTFPVNSAESSTGGAPCNVSEFGGDPIFGVQKSCFYQVTPAASASGGLGNNNPTVGGGGMSQSGGDPATPRMSVSIDSGSTMSAVGGFVPDMGFSQGATISTGNAIAVPSQYASFASAAVYQTARQYEQTYVIPGLTPNSNANSVSLLFAEIYWSSVGQRVFNVQIGTAGTIQYLNNFDIVAAAGAPLTAVVRTFNNITADANGTITIIFTRGTADQPIVNGVMVSGTGPAGSSGATESVPKAIWLTSGTPAIDAATVTRIVSAPDYSQGILPTFTLYNIPGRDCGSYSAGGAQNTADYQTWINAIADAIGNQPVIVLLEPDSLAHLPSDCGYNPTLNNIPQLDTNRYTQVNYAITRLEQQPHATVYLDAGNSHWQGVGYMAQRLITGGIRRAQGFFSNVSNYNSNELELNYATWISKCIAFGQNPADNGWRLGNYAYCAGQYYAQLGSGSTAVGYTINPVDPSTFGPTNQWFTDNMGTAVPTTHFVIDTSRNGIGRLNASIYAASPYNQPASVITAIDSGSWCNPPGRGLGVWPSINTHTPLNDALLWVKTPGESDGTCGSAGGTRAWDYSAYTQSGWPTDPAQRATFDPLWGIYDPPAGTWFPQQALDLLNRANPVIGSGSPYYIPPIPAAGYIFCASENAACNFRGLATVIFGRVATSASASQNFTNGTTCSNTAFGQDPSPGNAKYCWYKPL